MPETNDFINKLLSRNNDELDGILSYAENKKSGNHISNIKREDADAILKEFDTQKNITKIDSLNKNSNEPLNLNSDAQKKVSHTPDIRKITISDSGSKKIISHNSPENKVAASDSYTENKILHSSYAKKANFTNSDNKKNASEISDVKVPVTVQLNSSEADLITPDIKTDSIPDSQSADCRNPDIKKPVLSDQCAKKSTSKTKAASKNISVSSVPHNFHHIHLQPEICDYISYKSICNNQPASSSLIPEETRKINKIEIKEEISTPKNEKEPEPPNQHEESQMPDTGISSSEKFLLEQEEKHPRFYFAIGISIFLLTLLGLASCIYIGLNALKTFTKNYNGAAITSYYENNKDISTLICEKTL